jgi:hypothetical protein
MRYTQLPNLLFAPDATGGGGATAAPAVTPKAQPSTVPPASAPASAPPPAVPAPTQSDDPFERPRKPAAAPAKPGTAPATPPATEDYDKQYPNAPKELRERVKVLRGENQTLAGKIADYERRIASLDKSGQDTSALTSRLQALEKERDDHAATIRALKQEASPEFKAKYEVPFQRMADRAKREVEGLSVVVTPADPETGTPAQTRAATWGDFTELYALPTGKAIERAKTLFGEASQYVIGLREKLTDLQATRDTALEDERKNFKERNDRETAERATQGEKIKGYFNETTERLTNSNDDYKVDPTDTEAVDARTHALNIYDTPIKVTDETTGKAEVARRAHIRLKIGAYPVMKLRLERANEKIANLEALLAEQKGGGPGNVRRPGGETPAAGGEPDSVEAWMREAKQAVPV